MPLCVRAACRPIQPSSSNNNSTGKPLVSRMVNQGGDGVATSTTTRCASSSGMSDGSPTTLGNVVWKAEYDGAGGISPAFFSPVVFVGSVFAGSGHVTAWTKVPPICSPTIRTCGTFPAVTWATNALYGSVTSDVCPGKSDQRFHAINKKKTIHDSGLAR